jgi:hypothetical protein
MNRTAAVFAALAFALVCAAARGDEGAWTYGIEGGSVVAVRGADRRPIDLPAPAVALLERGDRLYVALGADGVAVLDLADPGFPAPAQRIPVAQGRVTGFVVVEGAVWMRIDSTAAVLVEGGVPAGAETAAVVTPLVAGPASAGVGAAPAAAPAAPAAPQAIGGEPIRILEVNRGKGEVKLGAGSARGVKAGDRFVVYRAVEMEKGEKGAFTAQTTIADLEAEAVGDEVTIANVWRGDRVALTDVARPAAEGHRPSRAYPRRLGRIGEASFVVRPLFNVGSEKGFGMLCDATAAWWGAHLFLDLRFQPLGFGWTDGGNVASSSILGEVGYDGRAFALGVGTGVGLVNGDMGKVLVQRDVFEAAGADGDESFEWKDRTRAAFALSQVVRLGARDGFNIVLYNLLLHYNPPGSGDGGEEGEAGFYYGGTSGRISIPIAARVDLFLGGGGGLAGYWLSEIGVFFWARGNGDAGSIGVSASGGAAGVWGYLEAKQVEMGISATKRVDILGPMISLGLTGRFGGREKAR